MRQHLYIGEDILDLSNVRIAINVKRIDIGNISSRFVSYTNNFRVGWTENNERIFGYARDLKSRSLFPYSVRSGKYVVNGIEVISDARIFIVKSRNKDFDLRIYENVIDIFEAIAEKDISDIYSVSSGWENSDIDAARTSTEGIISAVFSWGAPTATEEFSLYTENNFLPSFFYHTLVKSVLQDTGLSLSGDILTDSRFTDLVVPFFGESEYKEEYYSTFNSYQILGSDLPVTNAVNSEATVLGKNFTDYVHGTVQCFVQVGGVTWNGGTSLIARIKKNSVTVASETILTNPAPGGEVVIEYTDYFEPGDVVNVVVYSDDMSAPGTDYTRTDNCDYRFTATGKISTGEIQWNELFRGKLQAKDLLTDFFSRFGVIYNQIGNTLFLKTLSEIIKDRRNALDWSAKKVKEDYEIDLQGSFAQDNFLKYSGGELGSGSIDIPNETLPIDKTIFTSTFNVCNTQAIGKALVALIPVYEREFADLGPIDDFTNDPGLHILTLKNRVNAPPITFDAVARSDYKLAYFVDSTASKDTGFQYFIDQFYSEFESALQRLKIADLYFYLEIEDIQSYDPFRLIWDGDNYYILNRIVDFIPGKITKVELLKV